LKYHITENKKGCVRHIGTLNSPPECHHYSALVELAVCQPANNMESQN
jgi:hypothetical protein